MIYKTLPISLMLVSGGQWFAEVFTKFVEYVNALSNDLEDEDVFMLMTESVNLDAKPQSKVERIIMG